MLEKLLRVVLSSGFSALRSESNVDLEGKLLDERSNECFIEETDMVKKGLNLPVLAILLHYHSQYTSILPNFKIGISNLVAVRVVWCCCDVCSVDAFHHHKGTENTLSELVDLRMWPVNGGVSCGLKSNIERIDGWQQVIE